MKNNTVQVLLIEDNTTDVLMLREALAVSGLAIFKLTVVDSLSQGLDYLDEKKEFDVVVLDLGLPDSQGLETFERIHECSPHLPVIVLSGLLDQAVAIQAVQAGAQDYQIKGDAGWEFIGRAICYAIERQQAQAAVQASERRFRALIENSADAIALLNSDGIIQYESPTASKILGYAPEEMVGRNAFEFLHTDDLPYNEKLFGSIFAAAQVPVTGQFRYRHKDGSWRWIEATGTNLLDEPSVGAVVVNYRDITERKQAEADVRKQIERLSALRTVDRAINLHNNLQPMIEIFMDQLMNQLQVDAADIILFNHDPYMAKRVVTRGLAPAEIDALQPQATLKSLANLFRENRPLQFNDLRSLSTQDWFIQQLQATGFVSYAGVPLVARDTVMGVLQVYHRSLCERDQGWVDFMEILAGQAAVAIEHARLFDNLEHSNKQLWYAYDSTIEGWAHALDLRDRETEGHSRRVTELTLQLAGAMGISEDDLVYVRWGALLHDIGKMGVPDTILLKEGPLNAMEWDVMRLHPTLAFKLLSPIDFLHPALDIPYCHHERWDGSGYPRGLKGEEIPLVARIFAIVDNYDALLSDRPYRKAWERPKVLEYIRQGAHSLFDPAMVELFLRTIHP
ncbi:MAG: PAS domain S-box protein [Anaerolineaceae bacterium]|nr:PAS domain S-box protein [Anaerolineaceae bacterium]